MTGDKCGKLGGYQAHMRNGTETCRPCRDVRATWQRGYRNRMYFAGGPMLIDSTGTRRRLQALVRMGWTFDHIAERLGVTGPAARAWTYNATVHRDTAARVAVVYDELWDQAGPSPMTARRAKTKGWPVPLAWDDDTIDDPAARPSRMTESHRPFDDVAVQRAMHGNDVHLRPPERAEAVRRLTAQGVSAKEIAARLRTTPRTVNRNRATPKKAA